MFSYMLPRKKSFVYAAAMLLAFMIAVAASSHAETCVTSGEMDAATKATLQSTARQYFSYVAQNNVSALAQNSIADISSNPSGLQGVIAEHQKNLSGASATPRNTFLLTAEGSAPIANAEFNCGVFNSPARVAFSLQGLPPGRYGLVILDISGSKIPYFFSFLLLQENGTWKLAGLFPRPRQLDGHDSQWYWQQARDFKAKGQPHNAWFYYLISRDLGFPVPFISTPKIDSFNEEVQASMPADVPEQNPVTIAGLNGKQYQVTSLFVVPDEKGGLDLVVKYANPNISDTGKAFLENKEVMKALLAKYPEYRQPYTNLVARAVAPSGQDYGSMLPVKEVQ